MVGIRALWFSVAVAGYAAAQSTTPLPTCTNSTYQWTFNSLRQSPCMVAAWLGGVCNGGDYNLPPLPGPEYYYLGPAPGYGNACACSSVFYSLISACSLCQSADYLVWSRYSENCTTSYSGVFNYNIPPTTKVPHWAYLDVVPGNGFSPSAAQLAVSGGAESTNIPSSTSSSTSTTRSPTLTPGGFATSSSPATGSSSRPINAGAIAGAVVGGVVGLALIAALVFCFVYRRRTQRPQSTVNLMSPSMPTSPVSPATFGPTSKLYDSQDPNMAPSRTTSATGTMQEHYPQFYPAQLLPGGLYPARGQAFPPEV